MPRTTLLRTLEMQKKGSFDRASTLGMRSAQISQHLPPWPDLLLQVIFVNSQLSTYYRFNEKTFAELFAPDTEVTSLFFRGVCSG